MNGRRARKVALAVVAVLAVALVASAAVPVFSQDQGSSGGGGSKPTTNATAVETPDEPIVPIGPFVLGVVVLGVLAIAVQFVEDPRGTLLQALGVVVIAGLAFGIIELLGEISSPSSPPDKQAPNPNATPTPNGSSGFGGGTSDPLVLPLDTIATVVVVAGALGVVAMLAWRSDRVRSTIPGLAEAEHEEQDADLAAVGSRAGEAADEVAAASTPRAADNAIYEAWRDLVGLLDVSDPRSSTPRQFATAAVEAGMDEADVSVLTTTFEEVRYGDAALSAERRERAAAALERIERTHGAPPENTDAGDGTASDDVETHHNVTDREATDPSGGDE